MWNPDSLPRFQFSLRWLMIAVTILAIVLGMSGFVDGGLLRILGLLIFIVLPTPLVVTAIYGRDDVRAFSIGALVPCAAAWADAASWIAPIGEVIWFLLLVGVCGAIAVATRRWIRRHGFDGGD